MADADDRIIGTADAAEILHWSQRKVQRAAATGAIPIVGHLGAQRDILFRAAEIEEIAKKEGDQPTTP